MGRVRAVVWASSIARCCIEVCRLCMLKLVKTIFIKSARVTGDFFFVHFAAAAAISTAAAILPTLFNFPEKPLKVISSNHTWLTTYGCGKIFWHSCWWPWVKDTKLPKRNIIYLVPMIKWEPLIQLVQNLVGNPPLLSWFLSGWILEEFCWIVFTRGQFWPSGIVVACVCVCVCVCMCVCPSIMSLSA